MDMISKTISTFDKERQFKTYSIFRKLVYGKIQSLMAKDIAQSIAYLKKRHGLNKEDVFIRLFGRYQDNRYYLKFREYSDNLEKFIAVYLCKELDELKKQLDRNKIDESTGRIYQELLAENKEQELLSHAYVCFQWIIGGYGNYAINYAIRKKIKPLMGKYGMTRQEILYELFEDFLEKKIHLRYDSRRASLYTFLLYHINNRLTDKLRKMKNLDNETKVNEIDDASCYANGISFLESLDESTAYSKETPETLLIQKQLIEHLVKFLGEDDAKVLLGLESRKSEAERIGLGYDAYCKKLRRKIMRNLSEFEKAGYC